MRSEDILLLIILLVPILVGCIVPLVLFISDKKEAAMKKELAKLENEKNLTEANNVKQLLSLENVDPLWIQQIIKNQKEVIAKCKSHVRSNNAYQLAQKVEYYQSNPRTISIAKDFSSVYIECIKLLSDRIDHKKRFSYLHAYINANQDNISGRIDGKGEDNKIDKALYPLLRGSHKIYVNYKDEYISPLCDVDALAITLAIINYTEILVRVYFKNDLDHSHAISNEGTNLYYRVQNLNYQPPKTL